MLVKTLDPTINLPKWVTEHICSDIKININDIANSICKNAILDIHFKINAYEYGICERLKEKNIFGNILRIKHTGSIENIPGFQKWRLNPKSISASIPCIIIEKIFD